MMKKVCSIVLIMIMAMSLFVVSASAEGLDSTYNVSANNKYRLATHYGYFEVDYGTVVGYGNIMRGEEVQATQACLKHVYEESNGVVACYPGAIDGEFGPDTYNGVYAFQVYYNLSPDGRAGDETFSKFQMLL